MATSLAGTGEEYTKLQARELGLGVLHIQGKGPQVNRDYGISVDLVTPDYLTEWVASLPHTLVSLIGKGEPSYVPIQARMKDGEVHIQIAGSPGHNRGYGAALDTNCGELAKFLGVNIPESE